MYDRAVEAPGERLVLRLWETIVEKGIGGLLGPWQMRRMERARIGVEREERLALAQTERDIEAIRSGRRHFTEDHRLVEGPAPNTEAPDGRDATFRALAATARTNLVLDQMQAVINVRRALLSAEAELENDVQMPPDGTVDDDWITRWRETASQVSSEKLQRLWGQVLAGEIKSPGSFSLRTLEFLRNLSQEEAQRIEKLAPFVIDNSFVFSGDQELLKSEGVSFDFLVGLQDLGIITQAREGLRTELWISPNNHEIVLLSNNRALVVEPEAEEAKFDLATYRLTPLGGQVLRLGSFTTHEAYLRRVGKQIKHQGFKVALARYVRESESTVRCSDEEEL